MFLTINFLVVLIFFGTVQADYELRCGSVGDCFFESKKVRISKFNV